MRVASVALRDFRNYERASIELGPGLTVVHGANGSGKTNLLEAVYFGCVGQSCRTSNERELVRFGSSAARVNLTTGDGGPSHEFEVVLEPGRTKLFKVDGARSDRLADVVERPLACVFMPDRLELVKGTGALRRAHLDSVVTALWPSRRETRAAYGRALAQRNALLSRLRAGAAARDSLAGWDHELARWGMRLMADRSSALELLSAPFAARAQELGLEGGASISYRPRSRAESEQQLEQELRDRVDGDLERGFTTHGPHRDDFSLRAAERDLRKFGSQGQHRLALLALLLAERDVLGEARGRPPVLLLDDVLSELDPGRRARLLGISAEHGQTLLTTADPDSALPSAPDVTAIRISEGRVDG